MNVALTYHRRSTGTAHIGALPIGSRYPVRLQSMANCPTTDVEACVAQAQRMHRAGAEIIRFTTQGTREVESLARIHTLLHDADPDFAPLVADVHFRADIADAAAAVVEKVRINPGNYIDPARTFRHIDYTDNEYAAELQRLRERFIKLLDICRAHHTALRIGVNHGSLSDRILSRYGDTPEGMAESCMEFLRIAAEQHFADIVISIKASNTRIMVDTVRLLVRRMQAEDMAYPLHLGVTEAGEGEDGRIKSAVGIGALLADGIGDTIRVSLSEPPENEIPVARALRDYFADPDSIRYRGTTVSVTDGCVTYSNSEPDAALFRLHAAAECGRLLWDHQATQLQLHNPHLTDAERDILSRDILQAARVRMYKTEYISCPGCGRTLFDLQRTIADIKAATAHLNGLKIGIMGCIVNGPGEMADADYGYVGAGRNRVSLYRGKECVSKNIPQDQAVAELLALIENDRHINN